MKTRIYLREWFYNAGIIGFLKILEKAGDNFAQIKENYIEFDTENLKNFHHYYFKYFKDKYDIAKKMEERISKSFQSIKSNIEKDAKDKTEEKQMQERIKTEKKYIKVSLKTQMDKIKKFDEETYNIMLEKYNQIDNIKQKEDIATLAEIQKILIECFNKESINNKLTMNLFKSILSKNYFGQPSFLNVINTALSFEEQQNLMYKDYVSNIIELDFLQDIVEEKYNISDIQKYIEQQKESRLITKEINTIYSNIEKMIDKDKNMENLQEYIRKKVFSNCYMCESQKSLTTEYTEKYFAPLAVSSDNMKNFFWNQNSEFPVCDICKLILFCTPAGITTITKVVKEYDKGKYVYKEQEMLGFVNYDTDVETLLKTNKYFSNISKKENVSNPYSELILNIVEQNKLISDWQLQNIFVVEFEAEYGAYSRIEYFNIKRYVAKFFKNHAKNSLNNIKGYKYRLQIVDYILKNKDINYIINDRLREEILQETVYGYNSYLATEVRMILNLLKEEDIDVEEKIDKSNKKLYVLYNLGVQIHGELKRTGEENKLNGYTYKMLNSIKSGNKKEFMDIIIRIHMSMGRDVSPIFLEAMQDEGLDFSSVGHSFLSGLISNKYEKVEGGNIDG